MKRLFLWALAIAFSILVLCAGVAWFGWFISHPRMQKTTEPVTREMALKYLGPKFLPASAHNIHYYRWYLETSPGFEDYIRFEAPVRDCHTLAQTLLGETRFESAIHPSLPRDPDLPDWFDPNHIAKGVVGGKGYDGQPQI